MAAAKKPEHGSLLAGLHAQTGDVEASGPALITRLLTNPVPATVGILNASYGTLAYPFANGDFISKVIQTNHVVLWVGACVLNFIAFIGANTYKTEGNGYSGVDRFLATDHAVQILGCVSFPLALVLVVASIALVKLTEFSKNVTLRFLVYFSCIFVTTLSTVLSIYMFASAAEHHEGTFFTITLAGSIAAIFAQVMLYMMFAALDTLALPRTTLAAITFSLHLITAIGVQNVEFATVTPPQKTITWGALAANIAGLLFMLFFRLVGAGDNTILDEGTDALKIIKTNLKDSPYQRAIITGCYTLAFVLSGFVQAFVARDSSGVATTPPGVFGYAFSQAAMLFSFLVVVVMLGKPSIENVQG